MQCFLAGTAGGTRSRRAAALTVHQAGRLQHLLVVGVVQPALRPEGDLPLHLLKRGQAFIWAHTTPSGDVSTVTV